MAMSVQLSAEETYADIAPLREVLSRHNPLALSSYTLYISSFTLSIEDRGERTLDLSLYIRQKCASANITLDLVRALLTLNCELAG